MDSQPKISDQVGDLMVTRSSKAGQICSTDISPPPREPDERSALSTQFGELSSHIENYSLMFYAIWRVLALARISPFSWSGRVFRALLGVAIFLIPPVVVQLIAGAWSEAQLAAWLVIAAVGGLAAISMPEGYRSSVWTLDSLHRSISDVDDLEHFIAWQRRWVNLRVVVPFSVAFGLICLGSLAFLQSSKPGQSVVPGTVAIIALLFYMIGETLITVFLLVPQSQVLARCHCPLYPLHPMDTPAIRQTVRGSTITAIGDGLLATIYIGFMFLLLPLDSEFLVPLTAIIAGTSYLAVFVGVIAPRRAIHSIVAREQERQLTIVESRIDAFANRMVGLAREERDELDYLARLYDRIRAAPSRAGAGHTGLSIVGSLILPTLSFLAAVAGEAYLGPKLQDIFERLHL